MEKVYDPKKYEENIYTMWEKSGVFTPKINLTKKPFTIILPLPNANDPMHMGHALFTVEDIMIRYHRMLGDPTLWLPGGDHAGIETQFVFEKHLAKNGESRFDYDRETLYKMIWDFANENKDLNKNQMRLLGFSMDWSRYHYSLEPDIVKKVMLAFRKLHGDGLVYRGERIVNFCTHCGTAYSDLEIKHVERKDPLYYIKYGPFVLATTRPETKFGDTGVAYHPGDKRYEKYLGQDVKVEGVNGSFKVRVVADESIDPDFGTGIEKVTPGHDAMDFEIGLRHNLPVKSVIDTFGRLTRDAGRFAGMKVKDARSAVVKAMEEKGLIDHIDENYTHQIAICYKCGTTIEPLVIPQWFIKTKPLAKPAIDAVKRGKTKIFPKKRFEKLYFDWMNNIKDWNISRQIVWGPRIPVWYCLKCNPKIQINFIDDEGKRISGEYNILIKKYRFESIKKGLQSMLAPKDASYQLESGACKKCKSSETFQETDTFDTWFLSSQWPLNTLGFNLKNPQNNSEDFKYFYPTSVMDTLWDILFFWVGRMMMMGLYLAKEVPFKVIHLHARVVDKFGKKMSKSKGNVVNPIELVDKYGADALRMALIMGVAPASDIAISDEKVLGMRNFTNKLWNISRFINSKLESAGIKTFTSLPEYSKNLSGLKAEDKKIISKFYKIIEHTTRGIETYKFGVVSEKLYAFIWHDFADKYIESVKERVISNDSSPLIILRHILFNYLKLLHPFMPYVTESIWQEMKHQRKYPDKMLIESTWPELH